MLTCARSPLALLLTVLISVPAAYAFQTPLSDESIREAYFLGQRNDETTLAFFRPYLQAFDRPKTGPYVYEVEVYTPFSQLVEISGRRNNYSAQQAALDYRQTTDTIFVRVRIQFTPSYGTAQYFASYPSEARSPQPQIANFSRDFRIGLSQNDQWIEPLDINFHLTNTVPTGHFAFDPDGLSAWINGSRYGSDSAVSGWLVWLAFDAKAVQSDDAAVEVFGPDDLHVVADYDLQKLR
jgi:hypothetical protein